MFKTKNNKYVKQTNKTSEHMLAHQIDETIIAEAVSKLTIANEINLIVTEIDLKRTIGINNGVKVEYTKPDEKCLWAKRRGRDTYTRVIMDESGDECSTLVVVIKRNKYGKLILITAYIGKMSELEPLAENTPNNKRLDVWEKQWSKFALVYEDDFSDIREASLNELLEEMKCEV